MVEETRHVVFVLTSSVHSRVRGTDRPTDRRPTAGRFVLKIPHAEWNQSCTAMSELISAVESWHWEMTVRTLAQIPVQPTYWNLTEDLRHTTHSTRHVLPHSAAPSHLPPVCCFVTACLDLSLNAFDVCFPGCVNSRWIDKFKSRGESPAVLTPPGGQLPLPVKRCCGAGCCGHRMKNNS